MADNGQLMEQLQSNLLALEQKRAELLARYTPGYRLVEETEQQIAQARAAIVSAAASPLRDETTDNDPTHEWVRTELARVKAEEDNYLLYLRKQEEARISDALDRQHISNVVITEPVNVSRTPTPHRAIVLLLGIFFSLLASVLLAVVVDAWDPTFRTPDELAGTLGVPVLASLSKVTRVQGA